DLAGAPVFMNDVFENVTKLGLIRRALVEEVYCRLGVRQDGGERLVDLVGDRAGEFTQRVDAHQMRDFLALQPGFGFRGFLLGDVDESSGDTIGAGAAAGGRTGTGADPPDPVVRQHDAKISDDGLARV